MDAPEANPAGPLTMQCMEVWGGNDPAENSVTMSGLDAWVYSRPYGEADGGGDVYYVSSCATGRITRLLVADVSGHGAGVCDVAGQLRGLMRRYVNYLDQQSFVRAMNRRFLANARDGCFATAVVTTYFAPASQLSVCNAGHPAPLLYRAATRQWDWMDRTPGDCAEPRNVPLGILELCDYDQFDVHLDPGDLALCYTDSLVEATDVSGQMIDPEGLLDVVRTVDPSNPATFVRRLMAALEARCGGPLAGDDITVLLFRPTGGGKTVAWRDRLLAPIRVLAGVARSLRPGSGGLPLPDLRLANVGGALLGPLGRRWRGSTRGR